MRDPSTGVLDLRSTRRFALDKPFTANTLASGMRIGIGRQHGLTGGVRRTSGNAQLARVGVLLALCAFAVMLILPSAPALALSERGHVFTSSFGSAGGESGQLSRPAGVAVNESTGDVYVVDRGNNRVERFDSSGKFISTWGYDVGKAVKERKGAAFEVCTTTCFSGLAGGASSKGQMQYPEGIAIDNSSSTSAGDVYVVVSVASEQSYVDKFSAAGTFLRRVTKKEETEFLDRIDGVSVDANGVVWVDWSEDTVTSFTPGEPNRRVSEEEISTAESELSNPRPGFAVDSHDNLLVNFEPGGEFVEAEEGEGEELQRYLEGRSATGEEPCEHGACSVVKLAGVANTELELEPGTPLIEGFAGGEVTALAADLTNDNLYADEANRVSVYRPDGTLIQHLGEGLLSRGTGVAIDAKTGNVYVADAAANDVDVFSLEPAGKPTASGLSAAEITPNSAELVATIDPHGFATSYVFHFSTASPASCSGGSSCESPIPPGSIAAGFSDQTASVVVTGLEAGTTYHYTVIATNSAGVAEAVEEHSFKTPLTEPGFSLADNRAWELVSPPEKNGAGLESQSKEGGVIQASEDGNAITYIATSPDEAEPEGNRAPTFVQGLATRGAGSSGPEWTSKDITITNETAQGVGPGEQQEYLQFSPDLTQALVEPFGLSANSNPALSPEATEKTIYVRHNPGCGPPPSTCYVPIVTAANATAGLAFGAGTGFGQHTGLRFITATPDFGHVVLSSTIPLTTEPTAPNSRNFYEWTAATRELHLVNVLPPAEGQTEGAPVPSAEIGFNNKLLRHAISEDGSRIVWNAGGHLYVRDMSKGETLQVDAPESPIKASELTPPEHPIFQTASTDTKRIFFTDEQRLTSASRASKAESRPDLYEFDVTAHKLTDLTTTVGTGESADVRGYMLGASEERGGDDGATAYFVANGVLTEAANARGEKATKGGCVNKSGGEAKIPGATCNLYVERLNTATGEWAPPAFITALSGEDLPDWEAANGGSLREMTARISPNGSHLAFMSDRSLTGYDNRDANPAAGGARDEEVFEYNRKAGDLLCASCNPAGARPSGVLDREDSGEGLGLLVDRPQTWDKRWLAGSIPGWTASEATTARYQSRYLSDSGRLFFDGADRLMPTDTNGKEDVYEYESPGEGTCASVSGCVSLMSSGTSTHESAFLDASLSGDSVFLLTAAPLTAEDHDTNFDVYDARVCSAASPCVSLSETTTNTCSSADECKAAAPPVPAFGSTGSASSGNVKSTVTVLASKTTTKPKPLTRAQKLAKALKACKKLKKKQKRASCEKAARKKYATKKKSAKHKKGSK